jgi:hypothetical protein
MAQDRTSSAGPWRSRLSRRVERARFDPCVRLDHVFLVDGHSLSVAGHIDRRVVGDRPELVVSPTREPDPGAARTPLVLNRPDASGPLSFSAHLDLAPLLTMCSAGAPTLSVWVDGLRNGPHAATAVDGVVTGRNHEIMHAVPPARDLGMQLRVETDDLRRVTVVAHRLTPAWYLLRHDIVGTRMTVVCRPSPIGSVPVAVSAVGPDDASTVACEIEPRGDNIAVHVDLVALSDAATTDRTETWTLRAAIEDSRTTAIGRARSDLVAPTDPEEERRSVITVADRRLTVTTRFTRRSSLALDVRTRGPRSTPEPERAP